MSQDVVSSSTDNWEKVLFLFLGWLLATLSPIIADAIRRRRESKEIKEALLTELRELKFRLACAHYFIEMKYGKIDRKYLEWLRPILADYSGPNPSEDPLKFIDMQLAAKDEVIAEIAKNARTKSESGTTLKKYPIPLVDEKISALSWLPSNVQALILDIRTHARILDEEIDQSKFYFQLTFDSNVTGNNRESVNNNLTASYRQYADRAKIIVDRITSLEKIWI